MYGINLVESSKIRNRPTGATRTRAASLTPGAEIMLFDIVKYESCLDEPWAFCKGVNHGENQTKSHH